MTITIRPAPIEIGSITAPRVTISDLGAEVMIASYAVRFRRTTNGDLVGGDVFIIDPWSSEIAIGSDLIDQLRDLAVELINRSVDPELMRCPECGAILIVPVALDQRRVTEVVCGPKHQVRFDDGSAIDVR